MHTTDEARRQAVANGWASTSLDQKMYAAEHGVSTRTLREWVRRYGVSERPVARAIAILDSTIAQLQLMRAALLAEDACRVSDTEGDGGRNDGQEAERHAGAEVESAASARITLDEPAKQMQDAAPEGGALDDQQRPVELQDVPPERDRYERGQAAVTAPAAGLTARRRRSFFDHL